MAGRPTRVQSYFKTLALIDDAREKLKKTTSQVLRDFYNSELNSNIAKKNRYENSGIFETIKINEEALKFNIDNNLIDKTNFEKALKNINPIHKRFVTEKYEINNKIRKLRKVIKNKDKNTAIDNSRGRVILDLNPIPNHQKINQVTFPEFGTPNRPSIPDIKVYQKFNEQILSEMQGLNKIIKQNSNGNSVTHFQVKFSFSYIHNKQHLDDYHFSDKRSARDYLNYSRDEKDNLKTYGTETKYARFYNLFDIDNIDIIKDNLNEDFSNYILSVKLDGNLLEKLTSPFDIPLKIKSKATGDHYFVIFTGYHAYSPPIATNPSDYSFDKYVSKLKAFDIVEEKASYHKMTATSTINLKNCIYQTYYYLYKDSTKLLKNSRKNLDTMLSEESDEIKKYVKNGELLNFLTKKANELSEDMYVEFFDKSIFENIYGFLVSKCVLIPIKDLRMFNNKKVFLYHEDHVAPRKPIEYKKPLIDEKTNFILKPKKENSKSYKENKTIIAYDFETKTNKNGKQGVFAACIYCEVYCDGEIYTDESKFYGENSLKEFCDYLDRIVTIDNTSKTNSKTKKEYIYMYGFNNSRFDNILLFSELKSRCSNLQYIFANNAYKFITYHNLTILDISLFYPGSLEKVSTDFKLEISKGVFPYSFPNDDNLEYIGEVPEKKYWKNEGDMEIYKKLNGNIFDLKEYTLKYCMLDCELVFRIAQKHIKASKIEINGRSCDASSQPTAGSIAIKVFQDVFLDCDLHASPNKIIDIERLMYKGGRTEKFKRCFECKSENNNKFLKSYDINSSYPASMRAEMPYKYINDTKYSEPFLLKRENIIPYFGYNANSKYIENNKNIIPNLLIRSDKNDIIALKNSDFAFHWGCELIEAIDNGFEIYADHIIQYEGKILFSDYVNYFYQQRLLVKNKKSPHYNASLAQFYKLLLNNLYGKFGQNILSSIKICSSSDEIDNLLSNKNFILKGFEHFENGDSRIEYIDERQKNNGVGSLVRFSSYISALSRCNLSKFMRSVGHENVYYCDTDSVYTTGNPDESLLSETELGLWKVEHEIRSAYFAAPKTYLLDVVNEDDNMIIGAKGHRQADVKHENFFNLIDGNKVSIENPSMFKRNYNSIEIISQNRTLTIIDTKRIWIDNESIAYDNYDDWHKNKY